MGEIMEQYIKLTRFLGKALGSMFSVVLCEIDETGCSVKTGINVKVDIREKICGLVLRLSKDKASNEKTYFTNHPMELDIGKIGKLSVFFIRDEEGIIIGALCIVMNCDLPMKLNFALSEILKFNMEEFGDSDEDACEDGSEPSLSMIDEMARRLGVEPGRTSQGERIDMICDLYDMSVYDLKGAVARTAKVLKISEQSVYRYLSKIKKARM